MNDTTTPIESIWPEAGYYISYRESDGAILLGKEGDSKWVEIPSDIVFGFNWNFEEVHP